jgi:hypothetical protein
MKEDDLKRLLERYYDGNTSEEEEQELREYLTSSEVPPGYEAEKELFSFFGAGSGPVPEPAPDFELRIKNAVDEYSLKEKRLISRRMTMAVLSAAAGLLILAGFYFFLYSRSEPADTYKDPKLAYNETLKILKDVSSQMNRATHTLKPVSKINEVRIRSFGKLNQSTAMIEKTLKPLGMLTGSSEVKDSSNR